MEILWFNAYYIYDIRFTRVGFIKDMYMNTCGVVAQTNGEICWV